MNGNDENGFSISSSNENDRCVLFNYAIIIIIVIIATDCDGWWLFFELFISIPRFVWVAEPSFELNGLRETLKSRRQSFARVRSGERDFPYLEVDVGQWTTKGRPPPSLDHAFPLAGRALTKLVLRSQFVCFERKLRRPLRVGQHSKASGGYFVEVMNYHSVVVSDCWDCGSSLTSYNNSCVMLNEGLSL